jgi:hypothetical protein
MSIKKSCEMKINDSIGKSALKQVQLKFVKRPELLRGQFGELSSHMN